jgi:PAS domain S-box-containing protein
MAFRPDPFLERFEPLRQMRRRPWIGYGAAVGGVVVGTLLRFLIQDASPSPFVMFYPFVIIATLIGGWRAGALSVVLSAMAADYFFLPPIFTFYLSLADAMTLVVFVVVCAAIVALINMLNTAVDRLALQAANVRFLLDVEPTGVVVVGNDGRIQLLNATAESLLGYKSEELGGHTIEVLVPDDVRDRHIGWRAEFAAKPSVRAMGAGRDLNARRKDGVLLPVEVGLAPFEREGRTGALATIIDISERKAAEQRQQILTNELRHRGRNLMAVVQAVASRILAGERSLAEARRDLTSRLNSLARAQELFLDTKATALRAIIDMELAPFAAQVDIGDCDIQLIPRAAQDFALIVHELATNALKHGALSRPEGRVAIVCAHDNEHFTLHWQESSGPRVRPPERKGFGHTILKEAASGLGEAQLVFDEDGFRYDLKAELMRITTNVVDFSPRATA